MKTLLFLIAFLTSGLPFELGVNRPNLFTYDVVEGDEEQTLRNQRT